MLSAEKATSPTDFINTLLLKKKKNKEKRSDERIDESFSKAKAL